MKPTPSRRPKKSRSEKTTRATFALGLLGILLAFFTILIFLEFWKPLVLGSLLALLLQKPYARMLRLCRRDWVAATAVCVALVLVIIGPTFSLLNLLIGQLRGLVEDLPSLVTTISTQLETFLSPFSRFSSLKLNRESIVQYIVQRADAIIGVASSATVVQAGAWGDLLLDFIIALMTVYFVLKDGTKMKRGLVQTLEASPSRMNETVAQVVEISRSIVVGTFAASFAQALIIGSAFALSGLPGAILASAFTFFFSFVPLLGSWPLSLVGFIYGWTHHEPKTMVIMVIGGAIAGIADNIVRVWFSADAENLHPLIILISILGGINIWGAAGVILGPLVVALLFQNQTGISALMYALYEKAESQFSSSELRPPQKPNDI